MVGNEVSSKYSRRGEEEYRKIVEYIKSFTEGKVGNYLVFFPSYKMLEDIALIASEKLSNIIIQNNSMNEEEREDFLGQFVKNPRTTKIGFCVLGGIFGEGIDLKEDRLIGVVVVGTGLPMVESERELLKG